MGYNKGSEIDISIISEPIDFYVLLIQSFLTWTTTALILFVIILMFDRSFIENPSSYIMLFLLSIIPGWLLTMFIIYFEYNILYRKEYNLINGMIDINYSPNSKLRRAIFVDDIKSVIYVERMLPFFLLNRRYWKYYKVFYFPMLTDKFYLIELVDNHKILYENKLYRLNQFKGNLKLVSNKYLAIPKVVLDEYKKRGYYFPKNY